MCEALVVWWLLNTKENWNTSNNSYCSAGEFTNAFDFLFFSQWTILARDRARLSSAKGSLYTSTQHYSWHHQSGTSSEAKGSHISVNSTPNSKQNHLYQPFNAHRLKMVQCSQVSDTSNSPFQQVLMKLGDKIPAGADERMRETKDTVLSTLSLDPLYKSRTQSILLHLTLHIRLVLTSRNCYLHKWHYAGQSELVKVEQSSTKSPLFLSLSLLPQNKNKTIKTHHQLELVPLQTLMMQNAKERSNTRNKVFISFLCSDTHKFFLPAA